jgi:hypothetical protein
VVEDVASRAGLPAARRAAAKNTQVS